MKTILHAVASEALIAFSVVLFTWAILCLLYVFGIEQPFADWFVPVYAIRLLMGAYQYRSRGRFQPAHDFTYSRIIGHGFAAIGILMIPVLLSRYLYFHHDLSLAQPDELLFYFGSMVAAFGG